MKEVKLAFFSVIASIAVPTDLLVQELRVQTLFPADQETERCLRSRLQAGRPA